VKIGDSRPPRWPKKNLSASKMKSKGNERKKSKKMKTCQKATSKIRKESSRTSLEKIQKVKKNCEISI